MDHVYAILALAAMLTPAYCLARGLRSPYPLLASVVMSMPILFVGMFLLNLFDLPITVGSVLAYLAALTAVSAWYWQRQRTPAALPTRDDGAPGGTDWACVAVIVASMVLFVLRAWMQPLCGDDTYFRWNFLAERIAELRHFHYYPPRTPEHFQEYFSTDGFPPTVAFVYAWTYIAAGSTNPALTAPFVIVQYAAILGGVYALANSLGDRRTGLWALAVAVSSPLLFWAVLMGQETGLTALAGVAMLAFLSHGDRGGWRALIPAASAAALGAIARDYGGAFVACGLLICVLQRRGGRQVLGFAACALLLCAPWYLRNWVLTGNPVFSNDVGGLFPVNPIHAALLDNYAASYGFIHNPSLLIDALAILAGMATVPVLIGVPCLLARARKVPAAALLVGVVFLLWAWSVSKTSGGLKASTRVLAPALPVLSVLAARGLGAWHWRRWARGLVLALAAVGVAKCVLVPYPLTPEALRLWWRTFGPLNWAGFYVPMLHALPGRAKVLTDDSYAAVALWQTRRIAVVPVWSPEVAFLFDPAVTAEEAGLALAKAEIGFVLITRGSNLDWLRRFPFYRDVLPNWDLVCSTDKSVLFARPPDVPAGGPRTP